MRLGVWYTGIMSESFGKVIAVHGQVAKVVFTENWPARHDVLLVVEKPEIKLEVISSTAANTFHCFILNPDHQLSRGMKVKNTDDTLRVPVGKGVLGRAFDVFGKSHDDQPDLPMTESWPMFDGRGQNLAAIENPQEVLESGIKAIDFFTPILRGGKTALVGGAGIGKTVTLTALINRLVVQRQSGGGKKVVAVFGAVGERSREAQELHQQLRDAGALPFSTLVLGQMGENPAIRFRTAYSAATIAEYFRDEENSDVLFFMDNLYRFAQAGHELSTLMGQIPSEDGYQPTLSSEMAELNERLLSTSKAGITTFMAIFVPSDDLTDHGVRSAFPYLDSMIVLSRDVYQAGRFPAVDLLTSVSAALNPLTLGDDHYTAYIEAKQILKKATDLERIVSLVGEEELSQDNQRIYRRSQLITNFMTQDLYLGPGKKEGPEYVSRTDTVDAVRAIINGDYDEVSPSELLYVGNIKNVGKEKDADLPAEAQQKQKTTAVPST